MEVKVSLQVDVVPVAIHQLIIKKVNTTEMLQNDT